MSKKYKNFNVVALAVVTAFITTPAIAKHMKPVNEVAATAAKNAVITDEISQLSEFKNENFFDLDRILGLRIPDFGKILNQLVPDEFEESECQEKVSDSLDRRAKFYDRVSILLGTMMQDINAKPKKSAHDRAMLINLQASAQRIIPLVRGYSTAQRSLTGLPTGELTGVDKQIIESFRDNIVFYVPGCRNEGTKVLNTILQPGS